MPVTGNWPQNGATSSGPGKLVKVRGIENLYRDTTAGTYYAVFYREGCTIKRTLRTIDRLTAKQALAAENASPPS